MRHTVIGFGAAIVSLFVIGCSQPGTEPTAEVTGTVTYKGKPIDGVNVGFSPERGRPASGSTDASGRFTLSTFETGDGAVPGLHKVGIAEADTGLQPMPGEPGAEKWKPPKSRISKKYADPTQSGFTAKVELGKKNEFTFDMTE